MSTLAKYIIAVFAAGTVLFGVPYEFANLYSARSSALQGANASVARDLDALYLNPANIGDYSNFVMQVTARSPFLGLFPSANVSAGFGVPIAPGVFGMAVGADWFMDDIGYMEYALRIGTGWNLKSILPGFLAGLSVTVYGASVNYQEFGTNFSYETNYPFAVGLNFSLSYSASEKVRGSLTLNNLQVLGMISNLPAMFQTNMNLPLTVNFSHNFSFTPEHFFMVNLIYMFNRLGDTYEIDLGYTWMLLPYLLDLHGSIRLFNIVQSQIIAVGASYHISQNFTVDAAYQIKFNTPDFLGDIYVSTIFRF